jgi:hypothetical protein
LTSIQTSRYDVVVVGGGVTGLGAATKAGWLGAKTLLVERHAFVGGMATAGMVSPFMKNDVGGETLTRGVFDALEEKMRDLNGMIDNGFSAAAFRSAAYGLLREAGADVLFGSAVTRVDREGETITALVLETPEGTERVEAKYFVDATGDAQVVYLAGLPFVKGDERTGKTQALTLFFRMGGVDVRRATDYAAAHPDDFMEWMDFDFDFNRILSIAGYYSFVKRAASAGKLSPNVKYIFYTTLPSSGEASFNTTNILDADGSTSSGLTRAAFDGRRQTRQVVDLLVGEIPGFENAELIETGAALGVRETRRAVGDYAMTGEDVRSARKFDDAVARGCYGVDIHGQSGEEDTMDDLPEGEYYEIPKRALFVKDARNLLAAGKCVSSTREGHAAIRVMPIAAATGEASGAIVGVANKRGVELRDAPYAEIREALKFNL